MTEAQDLSTPMDCDQAKPKLEQQSDNTNATPIEISETCNVKPSFSNYNMLAGTVAQLEKRVRRLEKYKKIARTPHKVRRTEKKIDQLSERLENMRTTRSAKKTKQKTPKNEPISMEETGNDPHVSIDCNQPAMKNELFEGKNSNPKKLIKHIKSIERAIERDLKSIRYREKMLADLRERLKNIEAAQGAVETKPAELEK